MLNPNDQQKTASFWTINDKLPVEKTTAPVSTSIPPPSIQTSQFEGEINPSASAKQLEIPVPTVQVLPQANKPQSENRPENSAPKIPVIPKTNKPPAAVEKIEVSSIKKAPIVPTNLRNQSTSNIERTLKPSNIFGDDQISQSASSVESDNDSVYEGSDDEEVVEEQRE
ncbi:hypothetical protein GcM1_126003, partial [Golovinomyces cichoracearum]